MLWKQEGENTGNEEKKSMIMIEKEEGMVTGSLKNEKAHKRPH